MKFRITGASGEIGSWLLSSLRGRGFSAEPLDFNETKFDESLRVVHLAAKRPIHRVDDLIESNLNYLRKVGQWFQCLEVRGKEFVFFSSNALYKNSIQAHLTEQDSLNGLDAYSLSKRLGELWVQDQRWPNALVVRIPGVLEYKRPTSLLSRICRDLQNHTDVTLTNGTALFNHYLHLSDLSRFVSDVAIQPGFDVVNLAPEGRSTLRALVDIMKESLRSQSKVLDSSAGAMARLIEVGHLRDRYNFECKAKVEDFQDWCNEARFSADEREALCESSR